jgi:glycosyltransferase involved in cell wall biosynthesis
MRLCFLADRRSIHTKRRVEYFAKEHEIDLITLSYTKKEDTAVPEEVYKKMGVRVHKVSKKMPFLLFAPFKIRRLIKKMNPDLVHAHYVTQYGFCGAFSGFHPLVQVMDESFYDRVKELIGYGENIKVIKEGIDPNKFKPDRKKRNDTMRILNLRKSQGDYKVSVLINAIPEITKNHHDVEFILLRDGKDLKETDSLIKKLKMENVIKFINPIPHEELPNILNDVDIYVDTFYRDIPGSGIGKTALEAMSCELPVVLSNTAGVGLHIKNEVNGLIYKGEDPSSLANAIIRLIEDEELRKKLGENAREYVLKNQDWNKNMKLMEGYYYKLLKKQG